MHIRSALVLGLATLLFACAEQPTSYAPRYGSYDGPEYAPPAYGYAPGYPGPDYGGSDLFMGGGGYWASGEDRDPYWYHRDGGDRDRAWQEHELRRGENDAQTRAQVWQRVQQQRAAAQAAQTQALQERAQAAQRMNEQRAQALAAQNQAIWQQRAAQQQALSAAQAQAAGQLQQQKAAAQAAQTQALQAREQAAQRMYEQRAQTLAAQQQALSAARARGLLQ